MKNKLIWIVLLLMATVILAGCSGSPATTQPTAAPAAATSAAAAGYPSPKPGDTSAPAAPVPQAPTGYPAAGQPAATQPVAQPAGAYPAQGQTLAFNLPGGANKPVSLDALKSLATVSVNADGKDQPMRKLSDALNMVGAATYTKVTATGQSGSLSLTKDQVANAYLDIQADGKIRLVVTGVDPAQWPLGVTAITVD